MLCDSTAEFFACGNSKNARTINEHLQNVFDEGELKPDSVVRNFRITAADGTSYFFCTIL